MKKLLLLLTLLLCTSCSGVSVISVSQDAHVNQNVQDSSVYTATGSVYVNTTINADSKESTNNKETAPKKYVNEPLHLELMIQPGYEVMSDEYGVSQTEKAQMFYIRNTTYKEGNMDSLSVSTLELTHKEPMNGFASTYPNFDALVQAIYRINQKHNPDISPLQIGKYAGLPVYEFVVQKSYESPMEAETTERTRIVLLNRNKRIYVFKLNGDTKTMNDLLNTLKITG